VRIGDEKASRATPGGAFELARNVTDAQSDGGPGAGAIPLMAAARAFTSDGPVATTPMMLV
jgi:hypothetical protein